LVIRGVVVQEPQTTRLIFFIVIQVGGVVEAPPPQKNEAPPPALSGDDESWILMRCPLLEGNGWSRWRQRHALPITPPFLNRPPAGLGFAAAMGGLSLP